MRWLSRDPDPLAGVIEAKLDALHRVARRLEPDPHAAADLVQETCLRAWRGRGRVAPGEAGPWLFRILRNLWVDRWRQTRRRPVLEELPVELAEPDGVPAWPGPLAAADRAGLERCFDDEVLAALEELPEPERTALLLHTFGDLTCHEISFAMECPVGTVMSRLARARGRLRLRLIDRARRSGLVPAEPGPRKSEESRHAQA